MYRVTPAPQPLPGTQLIQRVNGDGFGAYTPTPSYWGSPAALAGVRGLGCAGKRDCGCGNCGMGFFDSGLDPSGWGWQEWAAVGVGAYMVFSTVFTTSRATRAVRRLPGERRKRRASELRKRAAELSKK